MYFYFVEYAFRTKHAGRIERRQEKSNAIERNGTRGYQRRTPSNTNRRVGIRCSYNEMQSGEEVFSPRHYLANGINERECGR